METKQDIEEQIRGILSRARPRKRALLAAFLFGLTMGVMLVDSAPERSLTAQRDAEERAAKANGLDLFERVEPVSF